MSGFLNEDLDILNKSPNWIIQWGTTVILMLLGLVIITCSLVKYREIVSLNIAIDRAEYDSIIKITSDSHGGQLMVKIIDPPSNGRFLELDQKVIIKLNSFSQNDFGHLEGIIAGNIQKNSKDNSYSLLIEVKNINIHLIDNASKGELSGKMEVVTNTRTVLAKLYDDFIRI